MDLPFIPASLLRERQRLYRAGHLMRTWSLPCALFVFMLLALTCGGTELTPPDTDETTATGEGKPTVTVAAAAPQEGRPTPVALRRGELMGEAGGLRIEVRSADPGYLASENRYDDPSVVITVENAGGGQRRLSGISYEFVLLQGKDPQRLGRVELLAPSGRVVAKLDDFDEILLSGSAHIQAEIQHHILV